MDVSGITSADEHDHTYAALWASDLKSLVHLSIRIKAEWDFYAPYVPEGMKLDKAKFTVETTPCSSSCSRVCLTKFRGQPETRRRVAAGVSGSGNSGNRFVGTRTQQWEGEHAREIAPKAGHAAGRPWSSGETPQANIRPVPSGVCFSSNTLTLREMAESVDAASTRGWASGHGCVAFIDSATLHPLSSSAKPVQVRALLSQIITLCVLPRPGKGDQEVFKVDPV